MRKTDQYIIPQKKENRATGKYDIYPSFKTADGLIYTGYESLAEIISGYHSIIIDGYVGVFFDLFRDFLVKHLNEAGINASWTETSSFFKPVETLEKLKKPFIGNQDPLFGKRTMLALEDFFDIDALRKPPGERENNINIIIGPGAFLSGRDGLKIYIDLPKNEIQFRARAGSVSNLGFSCPADPKEMYKCFYFVDWVVLNKHKKNFLPVIDLFVDGQRPDIPVWTKGRTLRSALKTMSRNLFRARPWFEPGAWGGTWIKKNIDGLNKEVANYAWSFELITPENGLLIESSGLLLEASFDCLMYLEAEAVLGDSYKRFGTDFPIRFDFLDTVEGGNLSLQCHPRPGYMKEEFGEDFTQEETYYILDSKKDASVYLGFKEDTDPQQFRTELEKSQCENIPFDADKFILKHPSLKHDLFLIPSGTIHGSGTNNLVLEISTTPYIFTFKLYDWLRPDLDGKPRTLNINRGIENLYFDRKGRYVSEKLISKPCLQSSGDDWKLYDLPTHETQLYAVKRYHFRNEIEISTGNKCLVMSLVEGIAIIVETENGMKQKFAFAETFVIPAAAGKIKVINNSEAEAILVFAFVK